MAKQTTEQFKVEVVFDSIEDRFLHMMRFNNKQLTVEQTGHNPLIYNYDITIGFKDVKAKWSDLFSSSQWVEGIDLKITNSSPLTDEFDLTVTYAGQKKNFDKNFCLLSNKCKVTINHISFKTKNLGVLNPYGKLLSDDNKQSIAILKMYFCELMEKTGFIKKSNVKDIQNRKEYAITVISDGYFTDTESERHICLHLKNWKVGFCPFPGEMDKIKVLVSFPIINKWALTGSKPYYRNWGKDLSSLKRIETANYNVNHSSFWNKINYQKLFIGDPNLSGKLVNFIKELDSLTAPQNG